MNGVGPFAAIVATAVPLSMGWAQGIVIQERPVPLEVIARGTQEVGGVTYIPLEDVARALGSGLEFDPGPGRYTIRPGQVAILEHRPRYPNNLALPDQPRTVVDPPARASHRVSPDDGRRTDRVEETTSFAVGDRLVSAGIIIVGGKPQIPLDDLAAAMNSTAQKSETGAWMLVPRPGAGPEFLGLSERGIIIIGTQPRR